MVKQANPYPLRVDRILMRKLRVIATENGRSVNKEIELLIRAAIRDYERDNGTILLDPPEAD